MDGWGTWDSSLTSTSGNTEAKGLENLFPGGASGSSWVPWTPQECAGLCVSAFLNWTPRGGCVLKEAENPYSHELHRGWWVWDAPSPSLGGTPERGPFACSPPAPSALPCSKGSLPLLTARAGMLVPGRGRQCRATGAQAPPSLPSRGRQEPRPRRPRPPRGDRSPGPAVAALPGETGAQAPPSPPSRGRQEQHAHTWPEM